MGSSFQREGSVFLYSTKGLGYSLFDMSFHVIFLSKVTQRYVTLFTKGMSRPFSCSASSGTISLLEKETAWVFHLWSFCSSAHTTNSLQWGCVAVCREHNIHISLSRKYQVSSANRARCVPGTARTSCVHRIYNIVARTEPWGTPADVFLGVENSPLPRL
jgi:hypothetical protein